MAAVTQRKLAEFHDRLVGTRKGSIEVIDAKVEPQFDRSGDEYVEVTLVLSHPPRGQETWDLEDAYELRQEARRIAAEDLELTENLAIVFGSLGDPETADDEAEGEPGEGGE